LYYNNDRRIIVKTAVSVRLSKSIADRLDGIAKETERTRSFIIQQALETYIEDYADLQIALDRLRNSRDEIISGKELRKALGL
jgi:RHH-type rel operon transcriptional repressor/antitoxin RelB